MTKFVLVEASPYRVSDGATVDLRFAGGGRRAYDHRGFTDWRSGIANLPAFSAGFVYGEKGWTGGALPQVAPIVFSPASKDLLADLVDDYLWIGAPITVRTGDDDLTTPVYLMEMTGTIASVAVRDGSMTIVVTDLSGKLDLPLTTATFAGTGALEGIIEAEGRLKRRSYGLVRNVEGFVLDKATNVYEFGDPAFGFSSFISVSDIGRPGPLTALAWQGSAAATLTALKASSPPAGGAVVAPSIACVKWWTQPVGPLTADIQADVGAGSNKAADVAARFVGHASGPAFDATSFAAVLAARTAATGIHIDSEETVAGALDRLLAPLSVLWFVDSGGLIRLAPVTFASPVETLDAQSYERAETYRPAKSVKVGYRKNHRQHSDAEISAAILTADITGLGALATKDFVQIGTGVMKREDGVTTVTPAMVVTDQGQSLSIVGQGPGATAVAADVLNSALTLSPAGVLSGGGASGQVVVPVQSFTKIGTATSFTLVGNRITRTVGGADYAAAVRGEGSTGSLIAEVDLKPGFNMLGFGTAAANFDYSNNEFVVHFNATSGTGSVYRFGAYAAAISSAVAVGKLTATYDGVRFSVYIGGALVYSAVDYYPTAGGTLTAIPPTLLLFPKWWAYEAASVITGLAYGRFTENNFAQIGGATRPANNATVGADINALNLFDTGGATPATPLLRGEVRTLLGIAASISGQGTGATASTIAGLNATEGGYFANLRNEATSGDNMVRNSGLLLNTAGWSFFGTAPARVAGGAGAPSFYFSSSALASGTVCAAYPAETTDGIIGSATPGVTYRIAWLQKGTGLLKVYFRFLDATLAIIGDNLTDSFGVAGVWETKSAVWTAPAGATRIQIIIGFYDDANLANLQIIPVRTDVSLGIARGGAINVNPDIRERAPDGRPLGWFVSNAGSYNPLNLSFKSAADPTMRLASSGEVYASAAFRVEPNGRYDLSVIMGGDGASANGYIYVAERTTDLPADARFLSIYSSGEAGLVYTAQYALQNSGSVTVPNVAGGLTTVSAIYTPGAGVKWVSLNIYVPAGAALLVKRALISSRATEGADVNLNVRDGASGGAIVPRSSLLTALGIASGFAGQGTYATLNALLLANGRINAESIGYAGDGIAVGDLRPQDFNSNRTESRVAGGFAGQAPAATDTTIEPSAQVGSSIVGIAEMRVAADYLGNIDSSQFPKATTFRLFRNGVEVTSGVTWSLSLVSGSITSSISGTGAGAFSATALGADSRVRVTAAYGGTTRNLEFMVVKDRANPPVGGTGGSGNPGTTASSSSILSVGSTSYGAAKSGPLTCKAGTAGKVTASLSALFDRSAIGSSGSYGKFQWRVVGGTWADVAAEFASAANASGGTDPTTGEIGAAVEKTGLTSGTDYEFQLLLRGSTATTLTFSGDFVVTGT